MSSPLPLPTGQGCCAHAPAPQTGGPGPPRGGAGSAILAGGGERDGQGCVRSPAPCCLGERLRPRPSLAWLTQAGRHPSRAVTGWCMFAAASSGNFPPRGGHVTCSHEKHRHRAAAPCPGSPAGSGGLAHVTVLPWTAGRHPHSWETPGVHACLLMGELMAVRPLGHCVHCVSRRGHSGLGNRASDPEDLIQIVSSNTLWFWEHLHTFSELNNFYCSYSFFF